MAASNLSIGDGGIGSLLGIGAAAVVVVAGCYVAAAAVRANQRHEPVGPAVSKALRAVAVPALAALIALVAAGVALVLVAFIMLYLFVAIFVAAFSGNTHHLGSTIGSLVIGLVLAVAVGSAALGLGGASIVRTWMRGRRGPPGNQRT